MASIVIPLWVLAVLGFPALALFAWWKNRPTFVTPRHGIKVYIKSKDIGVTPAEVDRVFDLLIAGAIAFYKSYKPHPDLVRHTPRENSIATVVQQTINGTFLYLDTKTIVPPQWVNAYPRAKDKDGNLLPAGSNVNGMGYPNGVAIRLEDERDLKPNRLDYTLGSSALVHEHMGHRCHYALYGHLLEHSKEIDEKAKPVWDAVRACKQAIMAEGL